VRTTYAGMIPANFLADMSCEDFEARWRGWTGQPGGHGIFYVVELRSGRIVGFASGGPRREERYRNSKANSTPPTCCESSSAKDWAAGSSARWRRAWRQRASVLCWRAS